MSFRWIRIEDLDRAFAIIKRMHARGSVGDYALVSPERIVIEVKGSAPLGIEEGLAELGELDVVPYPETESDVEEGAPVEELDGVVTTREIHRPNGDGEHLRDDEGQGE